jgi:hypothetical protein
VLDPRISYTGLCEDYLSDPELHADLEKAKVALKDHFLANYVSSSSSQTTSALPDDTVRNSSPQKSPQKFDFISRYKRRGPSTAEGELENYFAVTSLGQAWDVDPLLWWASHRDQYPNLYRLARDVLCIPGSAVAVERVFSGGRDTIALRRASLKPDTIRTLMVVKARLRMARNAVIELLE